MSFPGGLPPPGLPCDPEELPPPGLLAPGFRGAAPPRVAGGSSGKTQIIILGPHQDCR